MGSREPADGPDEMDARCGSAASEIQDDELTEADKLELLQRLDEHRRHQEDSVSWDEARARLKALIRRAD